MTIASLDHGRRSDLDLAPGYKSVDLSQMRELSVVIINTQLTEEKILCPDKIIVNNTKLKSQIYKIETEYNTVLLNLISKKRTVTFLYTCN